MTVIHHSRTRRDDELSRWVPLDELLRSADVVSVHTPLTVETRGLIGARELGLMKRSAVLVNTSRGPVVDQAALAAALAQGRIFAAGLDVAAIEPIPLDEPLLRLPNCIVLPHIGSASLATRSAMVDLAVDNILAGLAGDRLPHCANPQVYGAATA
jgi:phosphoglycerate dehydrogenase-like enzyme